MSAGSKEVDELMVPVSAAIERYIKYPSDSFADIYNRAYEAVTYAICTKDQELENTATELRRVCAESETLRQELSMLRLGNVNAKGAKNE